MVEPPLWKFERAGVGGSPLDRVFEGSGGVTPLVRHKRFELLAFGSVDQRSIQLS